MLVVIELEDCYSLLYMCIKHLNILLPVVGSGSGFEADLDIPYTNHPIIYRVQNSITLSKVHAFKK